MRSDETNRRRDNVAAYSVAILFALATFLVLFLIGTGYFLSILFSLAVLVVIGLAHYLIWGRAMRHEVVQRRPNEPPH